MSEPVKKLSDNAIYNEIRNAEDGFNGAISLWGAAKAQEWWDEHWKDRFPLLCAEAKERKWHSSPSVIRLRFLVGETGRQLDAACGEALGWRVNQDEWWNWREGPVYDPPGDAWCIRKDARNDLPCNEALPHFTAESFERALATREDTHHEQ